ncbi:MAG TPA: ion channel [Nitrososphaeraceae archaeon]|nr:ion channel [Nitrososphaeraceae archaeon]
MKFSAARRKIAINIAIAVLTVASVIIVFVEYLFPLNVEQIWTMYGFDLIVCIILAGDFAYRLKSSNTRLKFIIAHWYEFPAMIPLVVYATTDSTAIIQGTIGTLRYLALFRLVRLYNLALMIKGSEIILLSAVATVTVVFGSFGIYLAESPNRHANINNLYDAFWWAIETITTVAYGEYYPVTFLGRIIAGVLMFAAIGILWTVVALITAKLVERKVKQSSTGIIQDTKDMIKDKIDVVESLASNELEELIRLIRGLNQLS